MDIALKLKRVVATLAAGALFASYAGVAMAQTFNDVPTDAWYYDYVEQLVDDGVIDVADNYNPADALNRAELVKIAITAIDGLAGYEAPATPTFDDVPADAWFFDYVEAAVQLGIVNGYTDANGNLTGMFGPGDTVNRAAATKILTNAFSVPTDLDPASIFPDVASGDWFYDYVVTAYNQSVLDGYDNGYFGPADPVTRAQIAKLVVNSQNPVERTPDGLVCPEGQVEENGVCVDEGDNTGNSEGDLEVSLNDDTAASSTLPLQANGVALAAFDITADQDDVYVSNLVVTRGGVGQSDDWANLYLYDGANRLTTGRTVNSDTNTATFPLKVTVEAGTTTTLTLVGDVSATAGASNQHYFYVASAANVTSNAQSVSGDFPVAGNTFTMGGATTVVNSVTVAPGTAPSAVKIGESDAEIASIKLTAGSTNDIALHQLALTNGGSLSSDKLVNLRLLRGTDEVATADGFVGDVVTFVLDTPYEIQEGQNKTFYVHADLDGGRTTDNIKLYLDENTDVIAVDQQYGFGASVTNNFGSALANTVLLEGGDVTVVDNGPAATQIAQNSTNNELLNFSVTSARDLTVRDTFVQVDLLYVNGNGAGPEVGTAMTSGTEAGTSTTTQVDVTANQTGWEVGDMLSVPTASGTEYTIITAIVAADTSFTVNALSAAPTAGGTVTEVNPYDYIKNVKMVDLDSGNTLVGPMTDGNAGATRVAGTYVATTGTGDSYNKVHTEDYELTGGDTRHLSIQADLDQNIASGYQIRAQVRFSNGGTTSYVKDDAANEYVASSSIIGAGATALAGNYMTTAQNSLAVALASTPTSQSYVKGDDAVPTVGIAMTAGDAGDITLKRLTVRAYADDGTTGGSTPTNWVTAVGNKAANTVISSITLYDGNDVVAGPESLTLVDAGGNGYTAGTDYYRAQFDDLDMIITKGGTKTLTAKVNLLNTPSATRYIALDVSPANDTLAEDDDANTINATGTALNGGTAHTPNLTILTSGTLSAYSEGNPEADNVAAGASEVLVAKYRFNALREDFNVNKLTIMNDATGPFGTAVGTAAISEVTLKYPDVNGVTQSKSSSLTAGTATISGLGFFIPAGENAYVEVYADASSLAAVGESVSGQGFRLGVQDTGNTITTFEAVGQASSTTVTAPTISNASSVNNFVVRKSIPTLAKASGLSASLINGENTLYGITVTADSSGSVSFGRLIFDLTTSGMSSGGTEDIHTFRLYRDSAPIATTDVNIYATDSAGANPTELQATAAGAALDAADGNAANGVTDTTYKIIVSFDQEEIVSAGSSLTYYLKAEAIGADGTDAATAKLATGDESTALTGLTATTNVNTGQVYAAADATNGIFTAGATDFSQLLGTNRNIIWSDGSADAHSYPTVAAGTVATVTGSYDWTNGYLLKVTNLTSQTLNYN